MLCICICVYVCIYIYIYMYREIMLSHNCFRPRGTAARGAADQWLGVYRIPLWE